MTESPPDPGVSVPIQHLVVLGHPTAGSFNHSVARTYCETVRQCGQRAELRDLYAIGFDPLLNPGERRGAARTRLPRDVKQELGYLADSAIVTLIYPIWFGMPPAIIKGYVDRVFGAGFVARSIKEGSIDSALHGKRLMMFSTSASTRCWLEEQGQWLALRRAFDTYLATIFGMVRSDHVHFDSIVDGLDPRAANEALAVVREKTRAMCALLLQARHQHYAQHLMQRSTGPASAGAA
ncbi:NAD(P)H-dependent oxidoreductase [Sphingomonas qomolangmaensis]|uniref:NAD(P)H-dependent oxidoreductase n=1 Tax=Sphingomonas qomolangmaensis TaxID=2918765 RepID=A0ABY5LBH6_9SPHN|nr:NAD(P)H-dependent oxidoreductase [Sphingomonas qomolangmaensis]UUL83149.1 NAD(P)H-dependent oxidoreductase [Sphingomonas qomolangmaensis]